MHIIGIELINDTKSIFKNLHCKGNNNNGWYPFCKYDNNNTPPNVDEPITFTIPYSFYELENFSQKNIAISCIVGKNGSGKSTLLDILYRIINNFAFCVKQLFPYNGCDLSFSDGFTAILYFSILNDGKEYVGYIKNNDKNLIIKFPNEQEFIIELNSQFEIMNEDNCRKILFLSKLQDLFYTIVTNYSMYSFNPEDFSDNKFYPEGIFHKNDAYITPIVLLPFRDPNGIILIDNERKLARQRIIALQVFLYNYREGRNNLITNKRPLKISYLFNQKYIEEHGEKEQKEQFKELGKKLNSLITSDLSTLEQSGENYIINAAYYKYYFESIKNAWVKKLVEQNKKNDLSDFNIDDSIKKALIHYLAFKTLKTCAHYGIFLKNFNFRDTNDCASDVIDEILNDHTFITLKIRQCFNYFSMDYDFPNGIKKKNYREIEKITAGNEQCIDDYFIKLPPSIFQTDLIFEDTITGKPIELSSMSSGELQLLNTFSYVLYHLKNLECDKTELSKKNKIDYPNYRNFLLVFDEAELYMHPEFQRLFLYRLIESINNCRFNLNFQIHIIIATHSPYILSDIPVQNVLMLDDGEVQQKNSLAEQTFAANIYDLLQNQFFMSASIGEIAKKRINEIINFCYSEDSNKEKVNNKIKIYRPIVEKLGDNYLRESLLYMLKKKGEKNV